MARVEAGHVRHVEKMSDANTRSGNREVSRFPREVSAYRNDSGRTWRKAHQRCRFGTRQAGWVAVVADACSSSWKSSGRMRLGSAHAAVPRPSPQLRSMSRRRQRRARV
jgi:hypothetical protein